MNVAAARVPIVRPLRAQVRCGLVGLHASADAESELVDQAAFGERMTILGRDAGWSYVQGEDGYLGWTPDAGLRLVAPSATDRIVVVHGAAVHAAPEPDAPVIDTLTPGAVVDGSADGSADGSREWLRCGDGWLASADTVAAGQLPQRPPTAADLFATAATFLGSPYLWGGLSSRGIDCSGLTQQVYRLNGVALPRDADQQALCGRPVDVAAPGDLLFFGAELVTHTAIATGPGTFVHAPRAGGAVEHAALGPDRALRAIRRLLP